MSAVIDSTVHPMPTDSSGLFQWIMNRHVHEYLDVEGRPVGEGRSMAYAAVQTDFKACPYPGSRHEHAYPMNDSALRSINPHWQNLLKLLGLLSHRYQADQETDVSAYYDLALVAGSGVFLSDYLALRQNERVFSNQFPVLISGLYKVCLGFQQATFLAMMNDQFKSEESDRLLPSAGDFYQSLEDNQMLIGEGEVCGGSAAMIKRAFQTMRGGGATDDSYSSDDLCQLMIDWESFDQFTNDASNLWRKAILFVIQLRDFCPQLSEATDIGPKRRRLINDLLKQKFDGLIQQQSGLVVEIAGLTIDESDRPLEDWLNNQSRFLQEIADEDKMHQEKAYQGNQSLSNHSLLQDIVGSLSSLVNTESEKSALFEAVDGQLTRYLTFETAILSAFNAHISSMQRVLGVNQNLSLLRANDLSAMCGGGTLRDWPKL